MGKHLNKRAEQTQVIRDDAKSQVIRRLFYAHSSSKENPYGCGLGGD